MQGVYLPGGSRVDIVGDIAEPKPGSGQVVVRMRASTICGSDIRAIYREHIGHGAEAYQNVIAGHEPCGEIVEIGRDCRRFSVGDRVIVYHIAGCGLCDDCRAGYMISCTSPLRAAYGWQRDGGHADYMLTDESTCVALPDELSYVDGACVACGFGTAYEALCRIDASGRDSLLVTGLGPVGMAAGLLAGRMGAPLRIGVDVSADRRRTAVETGAVDFAFAADDDVVDKVRDLTGGLGTEVSLDASGAASARVTALMGTRRWGRVAMVGEGGRVDIDVSQVLIHRQLTVHGSWVTSVGRMDELARNLVRWDLHPEVVVTHRYPISGAVEAYDVADKALGGKVAIVMD